MVASLYNPDNVVVGNAYLFLAPWVLGDVEPLIADDEPLFAPASWPSPWFSAGATHEGFKINVDTSTTTITIEEQSTPVQETVEGKGVAIEAALAEDTMQSMQLSWGGSDITVVPASSGVAGTDKMTLTDDIKYYTAALETRNYHGFARRIYIPKVSATGSGDVNFRRASDKRTYPIRFASLCRPTDIQIVDVTASALA